VAGTRADLANLLITDCYPGNPPQVATNCDLQVFFFLFDHIYICKTMAANYFRPHLDSPPFSCPLASVFFPLETVGQPVL